MSANRSAFTFLRDPQFALALAAGPLVWAACVFFLEMADDFAWPLTRPRVFLLAVVVYPVLEEIVFRGLLQGWLLKRPWGRQSIGMVSAANLAAAVAFAGAHLLRGSTLWAAAVLGPGLVFGYFFERHGLRAAILLHVFYNAGFVWLFWA